MSDADTRAWAIRLGPEFAHLPPEAQAWLVAHLHTGHRPTRLAVAVASGLAALAALVGMVGVAVRAGVRPSVVAVAVISVSVAGMQLVRTRTVTPRAGR